MQSDHKEIYRLTAERTGEDPQLYKDVGNYVFAALYGHFKRPKSLIVKLRGVGAWHLRKQRLKAVVEMYPPDFEKKKEDFESEYGFLKNENKIEIHNLFKERLKEYDDYITLRDEIRKIRYETQVLLEPDKREDESGEPS